MIIIIWHLLVVIKKFKINIEVGKPRICEDSRLFSSTLLFKVFSLEYAEEWKYMRMITGMEFKFIYLQIK